MFCFNSKYPFGKLDQVIQPLFNGSMENLGAIGISDRLVFGQKPGPASIAIRRWMINHEIVHMWFGNLVSMHWWDDESMIEGFCESFGLQELRDIASYEGAELLRYDSYVRAFPTELSPKAYSLTETVVDTPSYEKFFGGFMIRKSNAAIDDFRKKVSQSDYLSIVRAYLRKYAYGNFRAEDFYLLAGRKLKTDFHGWREFWYGKPQFHSIYIRPICTKEVVEDKSPQCLEWIIPDVQTAEYTVPELDSKTQKFLLEHLTQFRRPVDRLAIWTALWVSVQQEKLAPEAFLTSVSKYIYDESQPEVLSRVLFLASHKGSESILPGAIQLLEEKGQASVKKRFKDQILVQIKKPDISADMQRVYEWNLKSF